MKRLLLLLSAKTYRAGDFIGAARRLGVEVTVGSDRPHVLAGSGSSGTIALDYGDLEGATAQIQALHAAHAFDAVVAVDDAGTRLAARASAALGLAANPEESVVSAANKQVFREVCAAAGLASPWFKEISLAADPGPLAERMDYPCVLKPVHLSASRGVIRADGPAEFVTAFRRIRKLLGQPEIRERDPGLAQVALVEGFIPGAEVALEGLVIGGRFELLAFLDKPDPLDGPYFQETLFVTPSRHPLAWQERALSAVRAAVEALGLRHGAVHAELRLSEREAVLLELAPRSIGGHCSRMLRFGTGMTLEELILAHALGLAGGVERERPAAGVMMIPIPHAGLLREVQGVEEAGRVAGIVDVEIAIPPARPVRPPPEGDRYLGFIFARADTPDDAEAALREAHRRLTVKIDPIAED
ncbi:MAG: ATP-grasp domain-containing protein [bacterium]